MQGPGQEQEQTEEDLGGGYFGQLFEGVAEATGEVDEAELEEDDIIDEEDLDEALDDSLEEEEYDEDEDELEEGEEYEDGTEEEYEGTELDPEDATTEPGALMDEFVNDGLLDVYDEDKEYEDSADGLRELVEDNIQHRVENAIEDFRGTLPEKAQRMLDYFEEHGENADTTEFLEQEEEVDFREVDHTDVDFQPLLIQDYYTTQGYEAHEINDMIRGWENSGSLTTHARKARENLIKDQDRNREAREQERQANIERQEIEREQEITEFKTNVLNRDDVAGFPLSQRDKQGLIDYITKPVDSTGKTKYQEDTQTSGDSELLFAYLSMKGMSYDSIMKSATTTATRKVRKKINKTTDRNMSRSTKNRSDDGGDSGTLDLPSLFSK